MKKVIKGKLYDTDKAKLIGRYEYSARGWDLYYFEEKLYQKRTGEFFLYGEGGAGSKYCEPADGVGWWKGSKDIIPLNYKSAREWAEEHLDADTYVAIFGVIEEDDNYEEYFPFLSPEEVQALREKYPDTRGKHAGEQKGEDYEN